MSVGDEYLISTSTSGGELKTPILLNPLIKNAPMTGGVCTSGTYSVYAVILPTPSNWNSNHFKLFLITYDNFSTSNVGVTPDYPLPQPHILSQYGVSLNYYTWQSGTADVTIGIYTDPNNNQFFNLNVTGAAVTPHRSSFFFYGF
jgi:hypothetical protein